MVVVYKWDKTGQEGGRCTWEFPKEEDGTGEGFKEVQRR